MVFSASLQTRMDKANNVVTSDVKEFNRAVKEYASLIPEMWIERTKELALYALTRIVEYTPVRTGTARSGWKITIGMPSPGSVVTDPNKSPQAIIAEGERVLASLGFGQDVWISNDVDYIIFLEAGWSQQAPAGMVSITINEINQLFRGD